MSSESRGRKRKEVCIHLKSTCSEQPHTSIMKLAYNSSSAGFVGKRISPAFEEVRSGVDEGMHDQEDKGAFWPGRMAATSPPHTLPYLDDELPLVR